MQVRNAPNICLYFLIHCKTDPCFGAKLGENGRSVL